MSNIVPTALRTLIVIATLPIWFVGILYGWYLIDTFVGQQQVTAFIKNKEKYVEIQRRNPSVHSISLSHAPQRSGTLLIQFDVEEAQTYLRLEDELFPIEDLRFWPKWETNLRSKEDLGNNWGFAVAGIGEAAKGGRQIAVAVMVSLFICLATAWFEMRSRKNL